MYNAGTLKIILPHLIKWGPVRGVVGKYVLRITYVSSCTLQTQLAFA
jgi:hypothetical protein